VFVEGVSHKIRRQIEDLERAGGVDSGALTVDGVPVDTYLTRSGLLLPAYCPVHPARSDSDGRFVAPTCV
jgi:hypothetical protein